MVQHSSERVDSVKALGGDSGNSELHSRLGSIKEIYGGSKAVDATKAPSSTEGVIKDHTGRV